MKANISISKEQLGSLVGSGMKTGGKVLGLRVRTIDGKLLDFEELVFEIEMPIATK